ncbi:hypothetical protein C0995_006558 [Termitomyces sp. Mi166|nr:hypothetical protein C0995_006558 [Termitomyces sp. Mi166\
MHMVEPIQRLVATVKRNSKGPLQRVRSMPEGIAGELHWRQNKRGMMSWNGVTEPNFIWPPLFRMERYN